MSGNSFRDSLKIDNRDNHIEKAAHAAMQAKADAAKNSGAAKSTGGYEIGDDFTRDHLSENKPNDPSVSPSKSTGTTSEMDSEITGSVSAPEPITSNTTTEIDTPTAMDTANDTTVSESDNGNDNGGNDDGMSM